MPAAAIIGCRPGRAKRNYKRMTALHLFFSNTAPLPAAAICVGSLILGILLCRIIRKKKILICFASFFVYALAEYVVSGGKADGNVLYGVLSAAASFVFIGAILPSAFRRWTFESPKEQN